MNMSYTGNLGRGHLVKKGRFRRDQHGRRNREFRSLKARLSLAYPRKSGNSDSGWRRANRRGTVMAKGRGVGCPVCHRRPEI